jgi:hypothetical protein
LCEVHSDGQVIHHGNVDGATRNKSAAHTHRHTQTHTQVNDMSPLTPERCSCG